MRYRLVTLAGLLLVTLAVSLPLESAPEMLALMERTSFEGEGFPAGSGDGYRIDPAGLTLAESAGTGVYLSPPLAAPIPFNAVVPLWTAEIPELSDLEIMLRTANAAGVWSDWYDIHAHPDWTLPGDVEQVGDMITVPAADVTHREVQFSVGFSRYAAGAAPRLSALTLTFIDTTRGPTVEEMLATQQAVDEANAAINGVTAADGYDRPAVISRAVWCTDPRCDYSAGLAYEPATHMVVHHTVTANGNSDWAAAVRSIWVFHTFSRGWGDIGYNYLIDMNGIIYEGHNNQDYYNLDVIGTHAGDANRGGMGVALIGTFTTTTPPPAMVDAASRLLAWKADQRHIDVFGASRMKNIAWGLPHLMGHRDVYGGTATECPGGNAYNLLPTLRNNVASLIGFTDPHLYVDELSPAFTKSNNNWHEGPKGCGNNGHSYYTWSVTNPGLSTNWGEWRPNVPAAGRYEIEVYAPYCDTDAAETNGASYKITHANGVSNVVISHSDNIGLWMKLGDFDLLAGSHTVVRLTDLTSTDSGRGVWFDAIRLCPIPTATNLQPASGFWSNQRTINFSWSISNESNVQSTTLQVATDPAFSNIILRPSWAGVVKNYSHTFSQDYAALNWRVVLTTICGSQVVYSSPTVSGIDTVAPSSAVTGIYTVIGGGYVVAWQGQDALSGAATYNVDYRAVGTSTWVPWLNNTNATAHAFTFPDPAKVYEFRTQAIDRAGNVELPHTTNPVWNTDQAIPLPYGTMLPLIAKK